MTRSRKLRSLLPILLLAGSLLPLVRLHAQKTAGTGDPVAAAAVGSAEPNGQEVDEAAEYKYSKSVQFIARKIGVSKETASITFEWLNFGILAAAVLGFLFKALPKIFRDRTSGIQKSLVDARTATEEASQRLNSVEERLTKLDGQIAEMRAQAERDTAADEIRIKGSIEDESRKILAAADQEITAATAHAQRQLQQYAAELAIEQAAKKLVISAETDRLLVQGFVSRLGAQKKGGEN